MYTIMHAMAKGNVTDIQIYCSRQGKTLMIFSHENGTIVYLIAIF